MSFSARVLADSISPTGDRLTTIEATYPRMIHSEIMTHKMLSKSSASSRAIPVEIMLKNIKDNPFVPIRWGANQPGMQAYAEVEDKAAAEAWWRDGVAMMLNHAHRGNRLKLHKQIVNRFVETGMWITVIISGTTWTNFEGLRIHEAAEPHFQKIAGMIRDAKTASTPKQLEEGEWHLPLIYDEDRAQANELHADDPKAATDLLVKASVGRCARVSYLTHDGRRDLLEDVALHDRLMVQVPLHASPGEHVAQALNWPLWFRRRWPTIDAAAMNDWRMRNRDNLEKDATDFDEGAMALEAALAQIQSGNFRGFRQYRKLFKNEHIGERMP